MDELQSLRNDAVRMVDWFKNPGQPAFVLASVGPQASLDISANNAVSQPKVRGLKFRPESGSETPSVPVPAILDREPDQRVFGEGSVTTHSPVNRLAEHLSKPSVQLNATTEEIPEGNQPTVEKQNEWLLSDAGHDEYPTEESSSSQTQKGFLASMSSGSRWLLLALMVSLFFGMQSYFGFGFGKATNDKYADSLKAASQLHSVAHTPDLAPVAAQFDLDRLRHAGFDSPERLATIKIRDIRVGMRVPAHNPQMTDAQRAAEELKIDPASWRKFTLEVDKEDRSGKVKVTLLRPSTWLVDEIETTSLALLENLIAEAEAAEQAKSESFDHEVNGHVAVLAPARKLFTISKSPTSMSIMSVVMDCWCTMRFTVLPLMDLEFPDLG